MSYRRFDEVERNWLDDLIKDGLNDRREQFLLDNIGADVVYSKAINLEYGIEWNALLRTVGYYEVCPVCKNNLFFMLPHYTDLAKINLSDLKHWDRDMFKMRMVVCPCNKQHNDYTLTDFYRDTFSPDSIFCYPKKIIGKNILYGEMARIHKRKIVKEDILELLNGNS